MVGSEHGFRNRATSLLQAVNPFRFTLQSTDSSDGDHNYISNSKSPKEKARKGSDQSRDAHASEITNEKTVVPSPDEVAAENRDSRRVVRTIPTWVHSSSPSYIDDDDAGAPATQPLLDPPPSSHLAHHNHTPGQLYDKQRERITPVPPHPLTTTSRWAAFAASSAYPQSSSPTAEHERVSPEWLVEHGPDYSQPWRSHAISGLELKGQNRRKAFLSRAQRTILRNPIIPLVIRSTVWLFSLVALGLGAKIIRQHNTVSLYSNTVGQNRSTLKLSKTSPEMAVVVDAIALIYLVYITYDEYTGRPLGLRSAKSKMRLIFLDLFFIVFDSANLSLAYEAVGGTVSGSYKDMIKAWCVQGNNRNRKCQDMVMALHREQTALAWVLLVALVAWLLTFSISVMRLIDRTTQK